MSDRYKDSDDARYTINTVNDPIPLLVAICKDCGSVVADQGVHDQWHMASMLGFG